MVLIYLNTQIVKLSNGHLKDCKKNLKSSKRVKNSKLKKQFLLTIEKGKFAVNSRKKRIIE